MKSALWNIPVTISKNGFKFKSLSEWACNISVGCAHKCRFCYVPSASTNRLSPQLKKYGVLDPDEEWGDYVLVRPWQESTFLNSLRLANAQEKLKDDGNRAVMFCSTTDPFQTLTNPDPVEQRKLNDQLRHNMRESLRLIREKSSINVRILTRSPLARLFFDDMKALKKRLMFGMSIPTLNDKFARIYEPNAPAPSKRLATMQAAKEAGLNLYVAVAPVYPECDKTDMYKTLKAIKELGVLTIFMEPINIRSENVARIAAEGLRNGVKLNTDVFASNEAWAHYAVKQLREFEEMAHELDLTDRLHLWPDANLEKYGGIISGGSRSAETAYHGWLMKYWKRVSEWPK